MYHADCKSVALWASQVRFLEAAPTTSVEIRSKLRESQRIRAAIRQSSSPPKLTNGDRHLGSPPMKYLKKIINVAMDLAGKSKLDIEIYNLKENIKDGERELNRLYLSWKMSDGTCCPGCMFGSKYNDLCDQQDRRNKWLQILLQRKQRKTPM